MSETVSTVLPSLAPPATPAAKPGSSPSINIAVPRHVAIVIENDAQAEAFGASVMEAIEAALSQGVACLSVATPLSSILSRESLQQICRCGVRITGAIDLSGIETPAAGTERLRLHLLSSADGGDEIAVAIKRLAEKVQRGELEPKSLTTDMLAAELDRDGLPPVDLLLHTAGARRLSRLLLWKAAYAELFFSSAPWSAFRQRDMLDALANFAGRRRTFGGLAARA